MKKTFLCIFLAFLATTNGTNPNIGTRCYFKDYRECIESWGDKENLYKCLEKLTSVPKKCGNEEICSTIALTLPNDLIFEQRGCVHSASVCNHTINRTMANLEELGDIVIKEIKCGSCDSDLCNVTNLVKQDYSTICYFTDIANCFRMLPQDFSPKAQDERFNCLTDAKHLRCGINQMCYSKFNTFADNTTLVLKGCSDRVSRECPTDGNKDSYRYYLGKNLYEEPFCGYCEGYLCNNEMSLNKRHKKVRVQCLMTEHKNCLQVPQDNKSLMVPQSSADSKDKRLGCLKNIVTTTQDCSKACETLFVKIDGEEQQLIFRDCLEKITNLQKTLHEVMQAAIGKNITNMRSHLCDFDFCNTIIPNTNTALVCYQSSLIPCLENLTLIIPPERMFECVKKMNRHKVSKECKKGEKCTTISLHLASGETINYLTCGTGPKELCESMIKVINMEKWIGKKVQKTECKYCEEDRCNNITEENWTEEVASVKTIECYFSDFNSCTKKLLDKTKPSSTELKKMQGEIYECFRGKPNKTKSCRECVTATFIFFEDKVIQAAFCESDVKRLDPCYIPHMERPYFKRYTGLTLTDTRCRRCLTPLCNNFIVSSGKKSEEVAGLATYQMCNFSLILILICFEFILLSKFCSENF